MFGGQVEHRLVACQNSVQTQSQAPVDALREAWDAWLWQASLGVHVEGVGSWVVGGAEVVVTTGALVFNPCVDTTVVVMVSVGASVVEIGSWVVTFGGGLVLLGADDATVERG